MRYKRNAVFLILAAILVSCVSALYMPTQNDAVSRNTSLEKLQQGRSLYINKCASCHNLHLPSSYTGTEWAALLNKMQKRAKIDNVQKEQIAAYLETNSKK
jgi:hypothetical protein